MFKFNDMTHKLLARKHQLIVTLVALFCVAVTAGNARAAVVAGTPTTTKVSDNVTQYTAGINYVRWSIAGSRMAYSNAARLYMYDNTVQEFQYTKPAANIKAPNHALVHVMEGLTRERPVFYTCDKISNYTYTCCALGMRLFSGNGIGCEALAEQEPNTVADVVKVEIWFCPETFSKMYGDNFPKNIYEPRLANGYTETVNPDNHFGCKKEGEIVTHTGTITYDNDNRKAIWTGRARNVHLWLYPDNEEKEARVYRVNVTIEVRKGDDAVCHPKFSTADYTDFRTATKTVEITSPTEGAQIFYTLDGSDPFTSATAQEYTSALTLDKTTTINAYAKKGELTSGVDTCRVVRYPELSDPTKVAGNLFVNGTYTWTNDDDETVTSNMSEPATDTWQIMGMLKEVYTNPNYPGSVYQNPGDEGTFNYFTYPTSINNLKYSGVTEDIWNVITQGWGIDYPLAQKPVDGRTTLLVKMHDDWVKADFDAGTYKHGDLDGGTKYSIDNDASVNVYRANIYKYIHEAYESVRMLAGVRIDDATKGYPDEGYNPGMLYLFNEANINRFFFISKGKCRYPFQEPLAFMFEEYAPTAESSGVNDVYDAVMSGSQFPVDHDCPSVAGTNHQFQMSPKGNRYNVSGLAFYLPDYRLKYWRQSADGSKYPNVRQVDFSNDRDHYTYWCQKYHYSYLPSMYNYTVSLTAKAVPTDQERKYLSTPAWESSLDQITPANGVPQEFNLFTVTTGENGEEILTQVNDKPINNLFEYPYLVDQKQETYHIKYVVKARPAGSDGDWVLSNHAQVMIPGVDETDMGLIDLGDAYTSTYYYNNGDGYNAYRNYITMVNDDDNPIAGSHFAVGTKLNFWRIEHTESGENETEKQFATVEITGIKATGTKDRKTGTKTVTVTETVTEVDPETGEEKQVEKEVEKEVDVIETVPCDFEYSFKVTYANQDHADDALYKYNTGKFTSEFKDSRIVFKQNGEKFYLVDQFSASTANNDHCREYGYVLKFVSADNIAEESYEVTVPVLHTSHEVMSGIYSKEEVDEDTYAVLDPIHAVEAYVAVTNNAAINTYEYLRNGDESTTVGRAVRAGNGLYTTYQCDDNGVLNQVIESDVAVHGGKFMELPLFDRSTYVKGGNNYVPVIHARTKDIDGNDFTSTYGADVKNANDGHFTLKVEGQIMSSRAFKNEADNKNYYNYHTKLTLKAEMPDGVKPYLYRLWRVENDTTLILLNGADEYGDAADDGWGSSYSNLALTDNEITVVDVVAAPSLKTLEGGKLNVKYLARLYSSEPEAKLSPARRAGAVNRSELIGGYSLIEDAVEVTFNDQVSTDLSLIGAQEPVDVSYYNVLGLKSSTPQPGVNIVVKTYPGGKTVSTKEMH